MLSKRPRSRLGQALAAGLVTASTIATPVAVGAALIEEIATPDAFSVNEDSSANENLLDVLDNDTGGVTGSPVITTYTQGAKGTVGELNVEGAILQLTYTPDADAFGEDSFTYTVTQDGIQEVETVTISIVGSQDAPVASADLLPLAGEIVENGAAIDILDDVLDNDFDVDGDSFTIQTVAAEGTAGTVVFTEATETEAQTLTYEPSSDTATSDSFSYVIVDTASNTSTSATVNITIVAVDDAPTASDEGTAEAPFTTLDEDGSLLIDVVNNDVDLDGEPVIIDAESISVPTNGTAVVEENQIRYTHNGTETTTDSFTYSVVGGNSATVFLAINPIDDAPGAVNDGSADETFAVVNEGDSVILDVLANDTDVDSGTLEVADTSNIADGHAAAVIAEGGNAGKIEYTHAGNDLADISFSYTLNGGSTASVFLSVANVTDDPFTVDVVPTAEIAEDADATAIAVLADGQTDGDGDTLALSSIGTDGINEGVDPSKGTAELVEVEGVMTLVYTPDPDANGQDTFTVEVSDGSTGDEVSLTITVNIAAANDAPEAVGDEYSNESVSEAEESEINSVLVLEDTVTFLPLLSNDTDVDEDELSIDLSETELDPAIGTLEAVDGGVQFTPADNYFGEFSFTYRAIENGTDPALSSEAVDVNVTVVAQPDAIIAVGDDEGVVLEDGVIYVSVLDNDIDHDGFDLSIVSFDQPDDGYAAIAGDRIRVEPNPNFHGTLEFTYTIMTSGGIDYDDSGVIEISCDDPAECETSTATVTVEVTPVNDRPDAQTDSGIETNEDEAISIDVLDNDSDIDGDKLSVTFVGAANLGTTEIVAGEVLYTPNADVSGVDEFVYFTFDGTALSVASVNLTIAPINDAPTIEDVSTSGTEDNDVVLELTVDDVDPDNESLTVAVGEVTGGSATVDGTTLTFTPLTNWVGTAQISVTVTDDDDLVGEGQISIEIGAVNDKPVIDDAEASTNEDESVSIPMTFSDIEDEALTIETGEGPSNGTAIIDGDSVIYTPADNFNGEDTFTVTTTDSGDKSATATVTVNVAAVNDKPVIDDAEASTNEDESVSIPMTFSDIEDEALTIETGEGRSEKRIVFFVEEPLFLDGPFGSSGLSANGGTLEVVGGSVIYTPAENFNGEDTFTVTTTDSGDKSASATVTVNVAAVNDKPVIDDAEASTNEDESVSIPMTFSDIEDEALTIETGEGPSNGTAIIDGDSVIYTPAENFNGEDTFTVTTTDSGDKSATATVTVNVAAVNDKPVIDDAEASTNEDESVSIPMTFSDIEDELIIEIGEGPSNGTAIIDGDSVIYTPAENFNGEDTFTVTTHDSARKLAKATVTVNVAAVNDAPVIDDAEASTNEDESVSIPMTFSDIEDEALTIETGEGPSYGAIAIDGDSVIYTPADNFNGEDTFTVTTTDSGDKSASATITVNVAAVNDVPTAEPCDSVSVESGKQIVINVAPCGADIDGDALSIVAGSATAAEGNAATSGDQAVTYVAAANYVGSDTVSITLTDGNGGTVAVSIVVTVTAPVNPYIGAEAIDGQVVRIYSAMLGRTPDDGGFAFWSDARRDGLSLERMIRMFAASPEFQSIFGNRIVEDTNEEWVDFVYGEIMNRTPDAGGRVFWLDMLDSGRISRSSMVVVFAESAEYQLLTQTS